MFNQGIYHQSTQMTGGFVGGSGTVNYVAKWTPNGVTIGNSQIFDNGTNVGINISSSLGAKLHVVGAGNTSGTYAFRADSSTVSNLFYVRNDGAVSSLNGYWIGSEKIFYINPNGTIANIFIGDSSGNSTLTGGTNATLGSNTLNNLTSGSFNIAFGYQALRNLTSGSYCVAIGSQSLFSNSTSDSNTAIGYRSLFSSTTSQNTAIGAYAIGSGASGGQNTAIGYNSMYNSTGTKCTAVGWNVLGNQSSADYNTAIGAGAGSSVTIGSYNTLIGYNSAATILTTGQKLTIIGAETAVTNAADSGSIAIGHGATITGNNQFVIGSAATNAGAVTAEAVTSDATWLVKINGTNYKILLYTI
jgi:hypothetical protein